MSEAEKPNNKDVCEALLQGPWVFVHLDPRREGVIVPNWFQNQPQLVLQLELNMAIPIPDLELGEEAITCTLSFSRQRHFCRLPWSAIYALLGDDARGMVWPEDVPREVAAQSRTQKPAAPKLAETPNPKVTALPKPAARAVEVVPRRDRQLHRRREPPGGCGEGQEGRTERKEGQEGQGPTRTVSMPTLHQRCWAIRSIA